MTTFNIHLDFDDEVVWWAETADIEGFTAVADSLAELRQLITEAAALHLEPDAQIDLQLVATGPEEVVAYAPEVRGDVAVPDATGIPVVLAFNTPAMGTYAA